MPKHTITILGIIVALVSIAGIPGSFKWPTLFLLGAAISYLSFSEHRHKRRAQAVRRPRRAKETLTIPVNGAPSNTITNLVEAHEPQEASEN